MQVEGECTHPRTADLQGEGFAPQTGQVALRAGGSSGGMRRGVGGAGCFPCNSKPAGAMRR